MTKAEGRIVSAEEIEKIAKVTEPVKITVGLLPTDWVETRPDLAGRRILAADGISVYLVNPEGYLQGVPNPGTYNNLFRDWNGMVQLDVLHLAKLANLSNGAVLARGNGSGAVYIVTNGWKRWITSPATMDKYHFAWNRVYVVPQVLIDSIPQGPAWS